MSTPEGMRAERARFSELLEQYFDIAYDDSRMCAGHSSGADKLRDELTELFRLTQQAAQHANLHADAAIADLATLTAQRDAFEADARRYRFLRDDAATTGTYVPEVWSTINHYRAFERLAGDALDNAIDTATSAKSFPIARLREVFAYDENTGALTWKIEKNGRPPGTVAGSKHREGYSVVMVDTVPFMVHRIIFALIHDRWPAAQIDHINCDPSDNRPCNLREATPAENSRNQRIRSNNKSGYKGVFFLRGRWMASIRLDGKHKYLGIFDTAEEASAAYSIVATEAHGQFVRLK